MIGIIKEPAQFAGVRPDGVTIHPGTRSCLNYLFRTGVVEAIYRTSNFCDWEWRIRLDTPDGTLPLPRRTVYQTLNLDRHWFPRKREAPREGDRVLIRCRIQLDAPVWGSDHTPAVVAIIPDTPELPEGGEE